MRHFDDRCGADDGEPEGFRGGDLEACGVGVDVEEEGLVAGGAQEGEGEVLEGGGEVVRYGR